MDSTTNQIIATGIISLFSGILASYITIVSNRLSDNKKLLAEYIAEVISLYSEFALKKDIEITSRLIAAIEKAMLFSNKETELLLLELHNEILNSPINPQKCGELMKLIHDSAKKQLND